MSLLEKYPCDNTTAPTYLSFSTASCSALIAFIAIVGNFLVTSCCYPEPLQGPAIAFQLLCSQSELCGSCCWTNRCSPERSLPCYGGSQSPEPAPRRYAACRFFYLLHRFTPEPGSLGSRSVRGHYVPAVLQKQAQSSPNILSVSCCLDRLHFIISLLLCSRLQQVSFHLREYCRRCDIFCTTFYKFKNFQLPPRTSK